MSDFSDDGGTPGWRARHPVTIDAVPLGWWAAYKHGWKTAKFRHILMAVFIMFLLPWVILIGGLICLALWDLITGAH